MAPSKKAKRGVSVDVAKKSTAAKDPEDFLRMSPKFSFSRYDWDAPWAVSDDGKPSVDSVFCNLCGLEGATWGSIMLATGGRNGGTNSHHISVKDLSKDARNRADAINLKESELFSLRIQAKVRLWGIIEPENRHFYVIWFDPKHKVYPV